MSPSTVAKEQAIIEITAEALARESLKDGEIDDVAMDEKYTGKTLRVRGEVDATIPDCVYLRTGVKEKGGQELTVIMTFPLGSPTKMIPDNASVVIEGKYRLTGVAGPTCNQCRLVKTE